MDYLNQSSPNYKRLDTVKAADIRRVLNDALEHLKPV